MDLKRMGLEILRFHSYPRLGGRAISEDLYCGACHPTHASFQQRATCLERLKSDVDKQVRGWGEQAETVLDGGLRILDQGPDRM